MSRNLDSLSIAALLVSVHYGLGFLLGTGEKALTLDAAGSLYAVSTSLGLVAIITLVKFYWTEIEPIWTLLGRRYGKAVKILIGIASWAWMIGVVASQILGGAFILKLLELPLLPSAIILSSLIIVLSLVPLGQVSRIFQIFLIISSLALLYSLWAVKGGLEEYLRSPLEFVPALSCVPPAQLVGIPLTTILLTILGMDFQQFIIQAKDIRSAYNGCLLGALILMLLAFVPSAAVSAAKDAAILPASIEGKQAIAYIISWAGGGTEQPVGVFLLLSLLVTALGSGAGVLRVMNTTLLDIAELPTNWQQNALAAVINGLLGLIVALRGGALVDLIVSFYAIYVAAVLLPFIAYLLDKDNKYNFLDRSVWLSLSLGIISAGIMTVITRVDSQYIIPGSAELTILLVGIGFSGVGFLAGKLLEKKPLYSKNI
ncbi:MAG: hypothetical protein N3E45_04830 [Oscillatoriaceae bacterium SKW80]|nr:hypothetical protein [Oscillatoriaceae bacterium SKYG93]MCX8120139.1 hypothetical protein [Oscillatoriaceae bacterium SKW80]MDW8453065.1 hypothetical protein [Oscillatoriaceae cyanobacterium SKYGB_i_bin93]HIK29024.1 hypothetical protein [Oscillatoriaceae cyanobacterium M7585_C2015_266]